MALVSAVGSRVECASLTLFYATISRRGRDGPPGYAEFTNYSPRLSEIRS
jgi:hypothetical protein